MNHLLHRLLFVILGLLLATGLSAQSRSLTLPEDGRPITRIEIVGTNRVSPAEIERVMELRAGEQFKRDVYRRDLQSIASLGKFDVLKLKIRWEESPEGLALTVEVVENPIIRRITIVGNVRFTQEQLLRELGFAVGDIQPAGVRAATIRNLSSFYRNGGFKDARVRVEVQPELETTGEVGILITIDERERVKIKGVQFRGNSHFNSFILGQKLTNSPGILFFNNYYDESFMEDDLGVLRSAYEGAGYLDVKVARAEPVYNEEKQTITLVFDIEQGPRYRVSTVTAEGVTYFTPQEIDLITRNMEGRLFSGSRLTKALTGVRRLYGDEGYINTKVDYRLEKKTEDRTAKVILTTSESDVSYVGDVRLDMDQYDPEIDLSLLDRGLGWAAPRIKDKAIMREVRMKTGEKYRTVDQVRTEERLRNLGIFRKVEVRPVPTNDPAVKDAVITVEEDPAAAYVGVMAGVGELSGPSITFTVTQPNMGGVANRLQASATFGRDSSAYRLSFFDRYLGESDTSLETAIYRTSDRYRAYRQRTTGASTEFGHPYGEYTTGLLRFRVARVGFSEETDDAEEETFPNYWVYAARPMLVHDRRDNRFWPTKGYLVSGGAEVGAADGFLLQFLHSLEWYHQFDRSDWIYAYRHSVGVSPYEATEVGLGERFFIGGSSSLRGFRARGVGPVDRGDDELHLGGATRLTQSHELRYPFNDTFKGRLFTDVGMLERGVLEAGMPRIGSGAGVIVDLGAVQVEVDIALPVLRESTDRRQYLHLRIGSKY